jgi:hypothetical protein
MVMFAVSPAFALGEGKRNYLLIGFMGLSPLIVLRYLEFDWSDLLLLLLISLIVCTTMLFHPESMRWSTVGFTAMFVSSFMAYNRLLRHGDLSINTYLKVLRYLIFAYVVMLLIQQFCVLMGLPIVNLSNYNKLEPWKLNSLMSEPSHSAFVMSILMYCYIVMKERQSGEEYNLSKSFSSDRGVWLSFLWTMVTMMSGMGFFLLGLILIRFLKIRMFMQVGVIVAIVALLVSQFEITAVNRTIRVAEAVLTLDERKIVAADHSASFRIVPFMRYLSMLDVTTADTWFGHGIDFIQNRFHLMFGGVERGSRAHGGFMLLAMDYGLLAFGLFSAFSAKMCIVKKEFQSYLFWGILMLMTGINSQLLWLTILLLWTNKCFLNSKKVEEESI